MREEYEEKGEKLRVVIHEDRCREKSEEEIRHIMEQISEIICRSKHVTCKKEKQDL